MAGRTNDRWFDYEFNDRLVTEPAHKKMMLALNFEQGKQHKEETLPKHFQKGASARYHYRKRSARWIAKKRAMYGEDRPDLVSTGVMAGIVTLRSKVTKTRFGWRIYAKNYFPLPDWMRKEIEVINQSERTEYRRTMRKKYLLLAKSPQYARRRSRRGSGP